PVWTSIAQTISRTVHGWQPPACLGGIYYAPVCFGFSQFLATKSCCGLPNTHFSASFYKIRWGKNHPKST
ncbi:hypothetical protein M3J43_26645, partial [Escherichia coli]|nr:hypothetical protein [Escherichia coli]